MDATSTTTTAKSGHESKLSASLKSRHLTMMSIAGVIGGARADSGDQQRADDRVEVGEEQRVEDQGRCRAGAR